MEKVIKTAIAKLIIRNYMMRIRINRWARSVPFIKKILIRFILFRAGIQLKYAIREADKKYRANNRRYYVIPNLAHRLIIQDRAALRKLRNKGYFGHDARMAQFFEECFYCTPSAFGVNPLSEKEKELKRLQWLDYVLQAKQLCV
jgi:hypothetical protein